MIDIDPRSQIRNKDFADEIIAFLGDRDLLKRKFGKDKNVLENPELLIIKNDIKNTEDALLKCRTILPEIKRCLKQFLN